MSLLALLYQILFDEISPWLPIDRMHISEHYSMAVGVSDQIIFIDLKTSREIQVAET